MITIALRRMDGIHHELAGQHENVLHYVSFREMDATIVPETIPVLDLVESVVHKPLVVQRESVRVLQHEIPDMNSSDKDYGSWFFSGMHRIRAVIIVLGIENHDASINN